MRRVRNGIILVVQDIGLGLTLVRHYAELHGGEVWVEDVRGGTGVRVVVRLPQG